MIVSFHLHWAALCDLVNCHRVPNAETVRHGSRRGRGVSWGVGTSSSDLFHSFGQLLPPSISAPGPHWRAFLPGMHFCEGQGKQCSCALRSGFATASLRLRDLPCARSAADLLRLSSITRSGPTFRALLLFSLVLRRFPLVRSN
jgi:hypothetical protein